jgi:hypothetical protein
MSFGFSGATDRNRYRFLSGFQLNDQGKNEDPTYLGFSIDFDFGVLGIDSEYGIPISPLFKDGPYLNKPSVNIFGQTEYDKTPGNVFFYSAQTYLDNREDRGFDGSKKGKRSDMLKQFKILLRDITKNQPWFFQSIDGLDSLYNVARPGYQDDDSSDFNPSRAATITINTLESLNLRITALADLYNHATFDFINMRETVPRNLRRFRMYINVSDLRNFYKTNRLINSSTTLSTIANTANLIGSGINPGNSLSGNNLESIGSFPDDTGKQGGVFGNVLSDIGRSEGITNQQDQSGIKPIILLECSNCEFDFTDSSPILSNINSGTDAGTPLEQSFKIHVGRVRIRTQYPNIRTDKNPLIISDDVFTNKSSVQKFNVVNDVLEAGRTLFGINVGNGPAADLIEEGGNILNNFIGNTINDLYDRGTQILSNELSGADQLLLGNAYSFNPSQISGSLSGNSSNLSLNSVIDFANQSNNITSPLKNGLPNPQTMGLGGPSENKYSSGDLGGNGIDVYPNSPGQDLGVTPPGSPIMGRVYPSLKIEDVYRGVPGPDLGVPGRVYKGPEGDVYSKVPGTDLGAPQRIYPAPSGDVYLDSPGKDLGVPQRVYPSPSGDVYLDSPGKDLGVPQRVYPTVNEDFYPDVPGSDLGSPGRVYPEIKDDVYRNVPGSDLGVPDRSYTTIKDDVYGNVPGSDLGVPGREYKSFRDKVYPDPVNNGNELKSPETIYKNEIKTPSQNLGDVYKDEGNQSDFKTKPSPVYPIETPRYFKGNLGDLYPPTPEDFNPEEIGDLGNLKSKDSYNISLGGKNPDPTKFNS